MKKLCLLTKAGSYNFWPLKMSKTGPIQGAGNLGCFPPASILHPMEMSLGSLKGINYLVPSMVTVHYAHTYICEQRKLLEKQFSAFLMLWP